jgi:hypothetical protein
MVEHCNFLCKVCEQAIPALRSGSRYSCPICSQYVIVLKNPNSYYGSGSLVESVVESESVIEKNYYLIFLPDWQEANVVERRDKNRIVKNFPLTELTHELAVQWVNKLKKYVTFQ